MVAAALGFGISAAAGMQAWWASVRGPDLLARTDNPRRSLADRHVMRGALLDRNSQPMNLTVDTSGSFKRVYLYPALGQLAGYTHPIFGQAGLESTLRDYLRGLQAHPSSLIRWDRLVFDTPPPGLDIRLSLDLGLQARADELPANFKGAAVLIDARSGETLVMASRPTYNPNALDFIGAGLFTDVNAPLLNRAAQGLYSTGAATHASFSECLGCRSCNGRTGSGPVRPARIR